MASRRSFGAILLLCSIVTISACQVTPPGQDRAQRETAAGKRLPKSDAILQTLASVQALISAGDLGAARTALANVDLVRLEGNTLFDALYIDAQLTLEEGDATRAGEIIARLAPARASQSRAVALITGRWAAAEERYAEAAVMLMAAAKGAPAQDLTDEIWASVIRTPAHRLPELAATAQDDTARGWWALANVILNSFDVEAERAALADWQGQRPAHPAARVLPTALAHLRRAPPSPTRIALLVPQSGPLAAAGTAVRDGFLAAFYWGMQRANSRESTGHTIRVYDSAGEDFASLYERVLADGMDVIAGPLDKGAVSVANQHPVRILPTLALNYLASGDTPAPDFLQLGLAIEDEAEAIAQRLLEDRLERVALFWTDSDWSLRAAERMRELLAGSACTIVVDATLGDPRTITDSVGTALLVSESNARHADLEAILGTRLEFTPRRRADLDAIIALTDSVKARALLPALAFHFAGDLPLYAPSPLTQGAGSTELRDLDGARVTQLPWRVVPDALHDAIEASLPGARSVLDSLYALGVDAYRIVDRIGALVGQPGAPSMRLMGATGVLTVDATGAFRREPIWAIVRGGSLVALPTIVE